MNIHIPDKEKIILTESEEILLSALDYAISRWMSEISSEGDSLAKLESFIDEIHSKLKTVGLFDDPNDPNYPSYNICRFCGRLLGEDRDPFLEYSYKTRKLRQMGWVCRSTKEHPRCVELR